MIIIMIMIMISRFIIYYIYDIYLLQKNRKVEKYYKFDFIIKSKQMYSSKNIVKI